MKLKKKNFFSQLCVKKKNEKILIIRLAAYLMNKNIYKLVKKATSLQRFVRRGLLALSLYFYTMMIIIIIMLREDSRLLPCRGCRPKFIQSFLVLFRFFSDCASSWVPGSRLLVKAERNSYHARFTTGIKRTGNSVHTWHHTTVDRKDTSEDAFECGSRILKY